MITLFLSNLAETFQMETGDIRLSYDVTTLSNPINDLGSNGIHTKKCSDYDCVFHIDL